MHQAQEKGTETIQDMTKVLLAWRSPVAVRLAGLHHLGQRALEQAVQEGPHQWLSLQGHH